MDDNLDIVNYSTDCGADYMNLTALNLSPNFYLLVRRTILPRDFEGTT